MILISGPIELRGEHIIIVKMAIMMRAHEALGHVRVSCITAAAEDVHQHLPPWRRGNLTLFECKYVITCVMRRFMRTSSGKMIHALLHAVNKFPYMLGTSVPGTLYSQCVSYKTLLSSAYNSYF